MPWVAGAIVGAGALSAGSSLAAGGKAASAAKDAADKQEKEAQQTRADLLPYNTAGQSVLPDLTALAKSGPTGGGPDYVSQAAGMVPGQMTQAELEATPGYQFTLTQGLKATQAAAAARGLGVSGAALKGASTYATGLADKTYQDQFNIAQQRFGDVLGLNTSQQGNLTNQFNRLSGVATLGVDAGAKSGAIGAGLINAAGNSLIAGGQAQAAGLMGAGNAISGAVNNYLSYDALKSGLANSGTTGGFGNADTLSASQVRNHGA
jgi:hypothetical protein